MEIGKCLNTIYQTITLIGIKIEELEMVIKTPTECHKMTSMNELGQFISDIIKTNQITKLSLLEFQIIVEDPQYLEKDFCQLPNHLTRFHYANIGALLDEILLGNKEEEIESVFTDDKYKQIRKLWSINNDTLLNLLSIEERKFLFVPFQLFSFSTINKKNLVSNKSHLLIIYCLSFHFLLLHSFVRSLHSPQSFRSLQFVVVIGTKVGVKMKVTIRTLRQTTFSLEIDPAEKISVLKQKIADQQSDAPIDRQKLIYAGRVLADEEIVSTYGIGEGEMIVLMITRPTTTGTSTTTKQQNQLVNLNLSPLQLSLLLLLLLLVPIQCSLSPVVLLQFHLHSHPFRCLIRL